MSKQNSVKLYDPTEEPLGESWNDWFGKWWNWLFSFPIAKNPMFGVDIKRNGKRVARNLYYKISPPTGTKNVIFLTGNRSGNAEQTCEIPIGNGIFFPVAACECSNAEFPDYSEGELEKNAHAGNNVTDMEADIGGLKLNKQQLENYKFEGSFNLDIKQIPRDNIFGADNQVKSPKAYSVGYWLFVKPIMEETKFDLMFSQDTEDNASSNTFNSSFTMTYHITIK